ncbi:MAG: endospore germination permease [Syntrophomonas sp.]
MKDRTGSTITSKQLIFVIIGSQIGAGIFALPRTVSAQAGEDAWIAIILGAVVPALSVFLIERLGRRLPQMGFTQMAWALFGKIIGSVLIVLLVAYFLFFGSLVVRSFAEIAKLYLLPKTPLAVILLIIIIANVYIGSKGARVLGRLNEILFYFSMMLLLILVIPGGQADYTNIQPVGEAGFGSIARGAMVTIYSFAGSEVLFVLYSLVNRKEEVLKASLIAVGITMVLYLAMVVTCLLVFGVSSLQRILWPGLMLLKVSQVPVLERMEFIFLIFWMGMGARPAINTGFAAALTLSQFLKMDEQKYHIYSLLFVGLGMYILSIIPRDLLSLFKLWDYAGYGFLVVGLGYPLLFLLAALMRGGKLNA